jgi:hypothetical protein
MAATVTNYGNQNYGGGIITGLSTATAQILFPPQAPPVDVSGNARAILSQQVCCDRLDSKLTLTAVSDKAFNLDYQFSPDDGTTWYTGQQVASSTITVDGATGGFVNAASITLEVGYVFRVQAYNTSGSNAAISYEWRYYNTL